MRLATWIRANLEDILEAWVRNAKAIIPLDRVSANERRDHAEAMLRRIATEMAQPQTQQEQLEEATGQDPERGGITSAQRHGAERMRAGVNAVHMTTEFRALRMSVIQLWVDEVKSASRCDLEDLIRFDEALDRALAESVESFTVEREKQERLFQTMLSSSPDSSYILDADGRFIHANRAATELCDRTLDQLIGQTFADLGLPLQPDFQEQLELVIKDRMPLRGEIIIEDTTGQPLYYETIYTPVINDRDQVEAVLGTARDVTQRRNSEALVWHHANYDPLTELPNRRLFLDRLEQQTKQYERTGAPFALFFIDLDRFKEVNDQLGHDGGDLLLKQAAERIRQCVRATDTVARLSGDEFTVILLDVDDLVQIEQIARAILTGLARPFHLGDDIAHISGSIGITRHPRDGKTSRQLLRNADQAMYAAKKSGRNQFYCFAQILEQTAAARATLANELREALAQQQLQLYYQPIVDLADDHRIVRAEALLRWAHPRRGLLLPADFLELAEDTGLISNIETWAFAEAAASSKRWNELTGSPFQVSLNISLTHFSRQAPRIPWSAQLKKISLPGARVAVEFSEGVFSYAEEGLAEKLASLGEAGITLGLDDFGTGHSSIAYLKRFNISYLKIDPSLVRRDDVDSNGQGIAEAIILMAHNLGLTVIAEGVETQEERDRLQAEACDYAQGFFFSEPLPARAFEKLLQSQ